ncbi:MAG: CHRD domain-containing protein [Hyphomicrobiales bacterium]|nr:CHRD domain-containing protein [Hyphomicrobiales bacterium]MDE2017100.1 CHRD domain-containing protein [Hyphomicrobiales bacterium]
MKFVAIAAIALGAIAVAPAQAAVVKYKADLSGANEVPPTKSKGTGTVAISYDDATHKLSWVVTYKDLKPLMAHFHGPAAAGANAGVEIPLKGSLASPVKGSATLTADEAKQLSGGMLYFNMHTAHNKGGAIRGQVVPAM